MKTERIDEIDVKILNLLQESGRIKRSEIAERVGLSVPSVSDRMRKLRDRGIIKGYHAKLDAKRLQVDIAAFLRVRVDGSQYYPSFVARAVAQEEVQEVHSITGDGSHILKVRVRNTTALEQLLSQIQSWDGVSGTVTNLVLSTMKEDSRLRIEPIELPTVSTNEAA
ncbi:MAG: Lrp/AsnC family transcriptional regulator [Rhodothermales bacterium]|nr:Lrp/AsnC family transcriptional regulator [Rhodothermales bacterium]